MTSNASFCWYHRELTALTDTRIQEVHFPTNTEAKMPKLSNKTFWNIIKRSSFMKFFFCQSSMGYMPLQNLISWYLSRHFYLWIAYFFHLKHTHNPLLERRVLYKSILFPIFNWACWQQRWHITHLCIPCIQSLKTDNKHLFSNQ